MKKVLPLLALALVVVLLPLASGAQEKKVPAGKEQLTLDFMSKARQAAGKKVLKGPVPFAHQTHVDRGTACVDCHHQQKDGEAPKPCHECHKDTKGEKVPKLNDAFHGGEVESLPSLYSCIGCHKRKVAEFRSTTAPSKREPCEACHSILKK